MTHRDFAFHIQTPMLDALMGLGHRPTELWAAPTLAPHRPRLVPSSAAPRRPGGRFGEYWVEPQKAQVLGECPPRVMDVPL